MKKLLLFSTLALAINAKAQSPLLEKTYDVSGKAKRGILGGVEVDKEKGTINMYYMLASFFEGAGNPNGGWFSSGFKKEIPCEVYSYDKDLNQTGNFKMGVTPKSYDWAVYNGLYTYEVVKGWFGLGGLSFQKQAVTYDYDPQRGTYVPGKWKVVDKEKPKMPDGGKYSWMGGYEVYNVYAERSALMILGKKVEKSEATKKNYLHYYNHLMKYDILICDINLNITLTDSFGFEFVGQKLFSGQIKDQRVETNDELARDWVLIYGPPGHNTPLYKNPKPTDWTYFRISPQGKIKDKIQFDSPSNHWRIDGAYEKDNAIYLYGPTIVEKSGKNYFYDLTKIKDEIIDQAKYTHYQIGKISNGKFDFLKLYSIGDMQAKMLKPPGQKKMLLLTGENEESTTITLSDNGDIYIGHQNFDVIKDGNHYQKIFRNMFMFQFDASGNLKKNYGIELINEHKIKDAYLHEVTKPFQNYFFSSEDGKKIYWFIIYPRETACTGHATADFSNVRCWPLLGADYTSINTETGDLSEMKTIGNEEKNPFYIFCTTKPRQMGNYVYFFSENAKDNGKGGDEIKITRVDISK